jgi:excisionase family DNA binding protein
MEKLEPRYTTEQVAQRYGVKDSTVRRWVREGRLTALNLGGTRFGPYVYRPADLFAFEQDVERKGAAV